ncbi:integrase family protein (plasmid) [Planctopirus limnophila DSM 3776]|uniref:Integrase family protein n=1 Tax=Planctopirus limnophila (strain ATCC 43296 / DSM 3776 / IFAM 1008 / Mu 290) TaxID=521674 RepID=D5SZG5_PLAL2|nr:tyrosine-type recombinase/integrase [Planctopirus limnophila]ADG70085.1 integrase family protein [Planctopirus limnophila DSM 3776]
MQNQFTLTRSRPEQAQPPRIFKLVIDDDQVSYGDAPLSIHSTLRECFEKAVLPEIEIAESTIIEYEAMLNHWERIMRTVGVGTIDKAMLKQFRDRLAAERWTRSKLAKATGKPRSAATVNKVMRHLKAVVMKLFPPDRHNPEGLGLVPLCKFPGRLEEPAKLPFTYSRSAMSALYRNAHAAKPEKTTRSTPLYRPELWQLAIVLGFGTGPRSWDLLSMTWDRIGWEDFKYGSISFKAQKTKKLQRIPLSQVARRHLEMVRDLQLHESEIFPMFRKTNRSVYRCWRRICLAAGLISPEGRNAHFEDLRKTCSTAYDDISPGVGPWITGHELQGVNAKNYQNPTKRVLKAVKQLKQPLAFREGAGLLKPTTPE